MSARARPTRETGYVDYSERDIIIPSSKMKRAKGGGAPKSKGRKPPEPLLPDRAPRLAAPVTAQQMGSEAIYEFLSSKVREQTSAIYDLARLIYDGLVCDRMPEGEHKPLLFRAMLAGTSGCGKTESVNWVRHLLGMDAGYEYENQCVELDASTLDDEIQVNSVIGAGAGLVGYGDGTSLPERLINALYDFNNSAWADVLRLDYESAARRIATQAYLQRRAAMTAEQLEAITPRHLMLFIDELDKATPKFITALNGLIETGNYRTNGGVEFRLPRGTRLFILYTANYGDEAIAAMPMRNLDVARAHVNAAMRESGLRAYSVARLERNVLIYYPLAPGVLRQLLIDKLDEYIAQCAMAREYGSDTIRYAQDVKEFLVDHVIKSAQLDCGVRSGLDKLFANLGTLFNTGLEKLRAAHAQQLIELPTRDAPIELTLECFNCDALSQELQEGWSPIMRLIIGEKRHAEALAICRRTNRPVNALGISLRGTPLSCTVYVGMNVANQFDSDYSAQRCEDVMDKLDDATDNVRGWRHRAKTLTREVTGAMEQIVQAIDANEIDAARDIAVNTLNGVQQMGERAPKRHKKARERIDQPKRARITQAEEARVEEIAEEDALRDERVDEIVVEGAAPQDAPVEEIVVEEASQDECGDAIIADDDDAASHAAGGHHHGRKPKEVDGFRYLFRRNHRAMYACNVCNEECETRRVATHSCDM